MLFASVFLLCLPLSISAFNTYEKKQHSLNPFQTAGWHFYGDAVVHPEFIRLTDDKRSQQGGVSSTIPATYLDWEVHLMFHVHGEGKHLYGDGFAFWYTQEQITFGSAFGARPTFRGLGVFFDTYANQNGAHSHDHPYISVMINNGSFTYDHDKDGTVTAVSGCSSDFRGKPFSTVIIQFAANKLSVSLKYVGSDKDVQCVAVDDVHLPVGYYFGLSAATGDLSDAHDIYSLRLFEVDVERPSPPDLGRAAQIEPSVGEGIPHRARVPDEPQSSRGSRILWNILFWLFVVACIAGVAFAGYRYYYRRQRQSKRLY